MSTKEQTPLYTRLMDRDFPVISAQVDPPGVTDLSNFYGEIEMLKQAGVTVVDVNSSKRPSLDAMDLSGQLIRGFGFDVIPHITLRDMTVKLLVDRIYGAYSLHGIRDFLVVTGDPYTDPDKSPGVFEQDTPNAIKHMNVALRESNKQLPITFAAAVNQNRENLVYEGNRLREKECAGTDFFMSQPVFTPAQAISAHEFYSQHSTKPLMMGLWPFHSFKTIDTLHAGKVAGVLLPDDIYNKSKVYSEDVLKQWSEEETVKLITYIKDHQLAQGIYLVAPVRKPGNLTSIVKRLHDT